MKLSTLFQLFFFIAAVSFSSTQVMAQNASSIANDVGDAAGDAVDVIGDVAGDVVDTVDENTGGSAAAPSYYGVKAAATVAGAAVIVSALAQS